MPGHGGGGGYGYGGYDGEPPLLEELGVNFAHIQAKTLAVLNPFQRIDQHLMDDSDLAGPIIFFLLFGTFLLFSGKVHFGYIYGLALLGSISLHIILSLMSPDGQASAPAHAAGSAGVVGVTSAAAVGSGPGGGLSGNISSNNNGGGGAGKHGRSGSLSHLSSTLTFARSASVLGYCLLPLVATSLVGIGMPMDTPLGIVMTTAAICWCTYSASGMFCAVGRMRGMRALVAYPLALFYVGFGIMGVFSSRGSGSMAKVIAARTGAK
ncbi:golgi membrane protein [Niveomyces insectorum RCEF 264]|uniref:Golgi membrane protein n=1 Tax=Niveomyces insectorum RCEF 264 TaxID=1081102 RepID=A0A167M1G2_9HYPO|nr:golgi membrane protein [Niveomyces insectorum RCEF 264]